MAEYDLPKVGVAGSNPVSRSITTRPGFASAARAILGPVAQMSSASFASSMSPVRLRPGPPKIF